MKDLKQPLKVQCHGQTPVLTRRQCLLGASASIAASSLFTSGALAEERSFTHAYGTITLPDIPKRIVSLGFTSQDALLALGVVPVAIRQWFGNHPHGVWPWAQSFLGSQEPEVLVGEVSIEKVASLQPDLIVAIGSGISKAEYRVLSHFAPVLMQDVGDPTYGTPWDKMTLTLGRALGKTEEAEQLVQDLRGRFLKIKERHPDWAGKTGVATYHWAGETGAFTGKDARAQLMTDLGFLPTGEIKEIARAGDFYARLSPEDLSPLDADLLVWVSNFEQAPDLVNLPMRKTLKAHAQGREVFVSGLMSAAMSFGTVLSLPFVLESLEAEIDAALDGDPNTIVPSAQKAGLVP